MLDWLFNKGLKKWGSRIKRVYLYDWDHGSSRGWDSALTDGYQGGKTIGSSCFSLSALVR